MATSPRPSPDLVDAYATAAYAMGAAARAWVEGLDGYEGFGVTEEGNCWATAGFPAVAAAAA